MSSGNDRLRSMQDYKPVKDEHRSSTEEDEQVGPYSAPIRKSSRLRNVLVLILTVVGALSLLKIAWDAFVSFSPNVSCACGSSIEEAKALGCHFDPIAAAWVRSECFDGDLVDEFNISGPGPNGEWSYYTDPTGEHKMSLDAVAALGGTRNHFFSTHEWHLAHCTFTWRKQFRAPYTGVIAGQRYESEEHIQHCEMMIKKRDALNDIVTGSGVAMNIDLVPHYSIEQGGNGGHEGHSNEMHYKKT